MKVKIASKHSEFRPVLLSPCKISDGTRSIEGATDLEPGLVIFDRLTWLDTKEAAKYLRKSANAVRIMVNRGYIRPRKFRRRLYFRKIELDRLLESSAY